MSLQNEDGSSRLQFSRQLVHGRRLQQSTQRLPRAPTPYQSVLNSRAFVTLSLTSAQGYMRLAAGRKNLKVLAEAPVTRVVTTDDASGGLTATSVQFEYNGELHEVRTAREVILCAG